MLSSDSIITFETQKGLTRVKKKNFQTPTIAFNFTFVASKGIVVQAAGIGMTDPLWYPDNGATHHMTLV